MAEIFQDSAELIKYSSTQCNQTRGNASQENRWQSFFSISQFRSLHFITRESTKGEAA